MDTNTTAATTATTTTTTTTILGGGGLWQSRTKHWTAVRSQTVIALFNVSYAVHIHHLGILGLQKNNSSSKQN